MIRYNSSNLTKGVPVMKLLIASDLHGSAYYCRKLLEFFQQQHADRLLLLGDLLYHGPRNPLPTEYDTQAVAAMLNAMMCRAVEMIVQAGGVPPVFMSANVEGGDAHNREMLKAYKDHIFYMGHD